MSHAHSDDEYKASLDSDLKTLPKSHLTELGANVDQGDLVYLIHELNLENKSLQIMSSHNPGYEILRLWSLKSGSTIRALLLVLRKMQKQDLVDKLERFRYNYTNLLVVLITSETRYVEELVQIPSQKQVLDVLIPLIRSKFSSELRENDASIDVIGYELLKNRKCADFKGIQLNVHVTPNETMKSLAIGKEHKFQLDDPVSKLPDSNLVELGTMLDPRDFPDMVCQLAHSLGVDKSLSSIESSSNQGYELLNTWSARSGSTFRALDTALKDLGRDDLRSRLEEFREDIMTLDILLRHGERKSRIEKQGISSQLSITTVLLSATITKFKDEITNIREISFKVNGYESLKNVKCEQFREKQILAQVVISDTGSNFECQPALEALISLQGFYDISPQESERILLQNDQVTGTYILRLQSSTRHCRNREYAISVLLVYRNNVND